MPRIKRGLLMMVGVVLLLFVVLVLVVPRMVSTEMLTTRLIQAVERATGAQVTLQEARLSWWGRWHVTLRDGSLVGTGAALTAATGTPNELESFTIAIEELSLTPALLPLLRKKLEIQTIEMTGPRLAVVWGRGRAEVTGYRLRLTHLNLGLDPSVPVRRSDAPGELIPADLSFHFSTAADTLVLERVPYTRFEAEGVFASKVLEVTSLAARRATGKLEGILAVDYAADPWGRLDFEATVEDVPGDELLVPWLPDIAQRLECDLDASVVGGLDLRDAATRSRTLDIAGSLTGGEGILHAADWLTEVRPYLGDRQDLLDIRFRKLDHQFRVVQGRYLLQDLAFGGRDTDWRAQGWVELEGRLAIGIDVKLPPGFTPDLGNFSFLAATLRDPEGRINLPLQLSGPSNRPTVGVDLGRLRTP